MSGMGPRRTGRMVSTFRSGCGAIAGALLLATALFAVPDPARALDEIVKKQTFVLPTYTTVGGAALRDVKVGWEAYGTLNADKSNVILITHFF